MNIKDFLVETGNYPNLKGFYPLVRAVEIVKKQKQISMTKELYPKLAAEFKTTSTKIERAIRQIARERITAAQYKQYGFPTVPTNSELIYYFALGGDKR